MTNRTPTYTPPPAPLGAPPVPLPPPAPVPLTVADRFRHLAGCLGAWTVAGVVGYGTLRAFLVGWVEPCAATLGWALAAGLVGAGVVLLVPFYQEWHAAQLARAYYEDSIYHTRAHYEQSLRSQRRHDAIHLRPPTAREPERVFMRHYADENVISTLREQMDATQAVVEDTLGRVLHQAVRARVVPNLAEDRTTQSLPEPPPPRGARIPYTADMRALVDTYLTTGEASMRTCAKQGLTEGRWKVAKDTLVNEGVLLPGKNKSFMLAPGLWHRDSPTRTHDHVARVLAYWP